VNPSDPDLPPTRMSQHPRRFRPADAHKLDDPERYQWLPPTEVLGRLCVEPGMIVADIGAGTGYFSLPLADLVGPKGRVHAVDVEPEMLSWLRQRLPSDAPVTLVEAEATRTTLPAASQDLVLVANVWHELDHPRAALDEFARILRKDAYLAIVDWRVDVGPPPGPPKDHRVPASQVVDQLTRHGWSALGSIPLGDYSYLVTAQRAQG
jgi:ubiquinone/menaquinone biosynthesis C-methylase UbiE